MLIVLYLVAIVLANLAVTAFGPAASIPTSFVMIALNLTTRDALHERWQGRNLWRNMALLIVSGSVLSAVINWNALLIALASCIAFAGAGIADTLVYAVLGERARLVRMNGSNVVSAAVDSVLFPALAFGFPLLWPVMIGDFIAKVAGGALWSLVLTRGWVKASVA